MKPSQQQLDAVRAKVEEEGMTLAAAVRTLGTPGDPGLPTYMSFHKELGHLVRRRQIPTLPRRAQARVDRLEKAMDHADKVTKLLEQIEDEELQVSISSALRKAAETRHWITDAIECIRIDNGITASGEARIETGVDA
jgi:hypothetical protein